ncbi:paraquat-inducible protein A [Klebsiella sp. I138]|uniref:paraquat-inducible protein A n=1 Tax=Klebsiella sp. I138 TaxID=2755385 RepID=UPI003DAA4B7B
MQMCRCTLCGLVCADDTTSDHDRKCPRCQTMLPDHQPGHQHLSWALLLTSVILYLPANILPVMYTTLLGHGSESTILSGIVAFWQSGSWGIAAIIFIASVMVPCLKFLSLGVLLISASHHSRWARRERTRLYRLTEWIGCWSMLDVVVVAVVCGLLRFRPLSEAEPRVGILFFALVVILTMLCALSFKPKTLWEDKQ